MQCSVYLLNFSYTFTEDFIEYVPGFPETSGPDLSVAIAMRTPNASANSQLPYIPKYQLVNILLGAQSSLQESTPYIFIDIQVYISVSVSTQLFVPYPSPSPSPSPTPTPTPSPMQPATHKPPTTKEIEETSVLLVLNHATENEVRGLIILF